MRVVHLSLVFLFAWEIRNGLARDPGNNNLTKSPSRDRNFQLSSGANYNPCEGTQMKRGALNPQSACHRECLVLNAEISTLYRANPEYRTNQLLHGICGDVTGGTCRTAADSTICVCNTVKESTEQGAVLLSACRNGKEMAHDFANARNSMSSKTLPSSPRKRTNHQEIGRQVEAVGMFEPGAPGKNLPTRARTGGRRRRRGGWCSSCATGRANSPEEGEEEDGSARPLQPTTGASTSGASTSGARRSSSPPPDDVFWKDPTKKDITGGMRVRSLPAKRYVIHHEGGQGKHLFTTLRVVGKGVVEACLDTGSDFSLVHPSLAGPVEEISGMSLFTASDQEIKIFGTTTISLEIKPGVCIPLLGYVTNRQQLLLIGANFYAAYQAKLKLIQGLMELYIGSTKLTLRIEFRLIPDNKNMMMAGSDQNEFKIIEISARVNNLNTRMAIDTGSILTIVTKRFVDEQTLIPTSATCSIGEAAPVSFQGYTYVNLQIGAYTFPVPALVPEFIPLDDFLVGNDFNERYVEVIDYGSGSVTFQFPNAPKVTTQAFFKKGQ